MRVNIIIGERLKLFDLVVVFFKFYIMRVFFCVFFSCNLLKKKKYTLKNIDSISVEVFIIFGRI